MAEIWDAYDRDFNKSENVRLIRGEAIPDGMYHLVCEIIVKHVDGTYLLMQRDFEKHFGGMWELTAGGSALVDEMPLDCAIRELREETGIVASELQELERVVHDGHHSLYVEYLCVTDCDKDAVVLQKGETVAYKWVSRRAILETEADKLASSRALKLMRETDI
ncbi:MAG: NUDIX hydrolase [Clostridia bacterium]|nr:NUDIX hydrolase [Clostridia bacterium]